MRETGGDDAATIRLAGVGDELALEVDALRVEVLDGAGRGEVRSFTVSPIRVGKAAGNDLVLPDPGVSRHHAAVVREAAGWVLRDLDTTNGTRVGGARIREVLLEGPVEVSFAQTRVRLEPRREAHSSLVAPRGGLGDLVGGSAPMLRLYALIEAVARTQANVLITGESGTGKEAVARTIHDLSRSGGPWRAFDCASADPELVRSDLFGHVKGGFTGAEADRLGAFRAADGGTLLLDELGELPPALQARLLRVLESREVTPIGADRATKIDTRVLAATHRDLPAMAARGEFREDLLYRLSVLRIHVPPLRERAGDLPALIAALAAGRGLAVRFGPAALAALAGDPWPGNVRQLRNFVERAAALFPGREIGVADLALLRDPDRPPGGAAGAGPRGPAVGAAGARPPGGPVAAGMAGMAGTTGIAGIAGMAGTTGTTGIAGMTGTAGADAVPRWDAAERDLIARALREHGGNQSAAARALGISRSTLRRRLKEYGAGFGAE